MDPTKTTRNPRGEGGGKLNRALPNIYETLGKISRSIPKTKNETLGKVVSRTLPKPKRETLGKLNSRTKAKLNGTLGKQSRTLPKLNGTLGKLNRTLLRGEPRGTTTMKQQRPESAQSKSVPPGPIPGSKRISFPSRAQQPSRTSWGHLGGGHQLGFRVSRLGLFRV